MALIGYYVVLRGKKCFLGFPSVALSGQRVDAFGIYTAEEKIAAIKNIRFPRTL